MILLNDFNTTVLEMQRERAIEPHPQLFFNLLLHPFIGFFRFRFRSIYNEWLWFN